MADKHSERLPVRSSERVATKKSRDESSGPNYTEVAPESFEDEDSFGAAHKKPAARSSRSTSASDLTSNVTESTRKPATKKSAASKTLATSPARKRPAPKSKTSSAPEESIGKSRSRSGKRKRDDDDDEIATPTKATSKRKKAVPAAPTSEATLEANFTVASAQDKDIGPSQDDNSSRSSSPLSSVPPSDILEASPPPDVRGLLTSDGPTTISPHSSPSSSDGLNLFSPAEFGKASGDRVAGRDTSNIDNNLVTPNTPGRSAGQLLTPPSTESSNEGSSDEFPIKKPRGRPPKRQGMMATKTQTIPGGSRTQGSRVTKASTAKTLAKTGDSRMTMESTTKSTTQFTKSNPVPEQTIKRPARDKPLVISLKFDDIETPPGINAEKLQLSQRLTKREQLEAKPLPQGEPRVWAESRQALCETLPYFKKPQGGCYQNEGHVYGFLFDSVGHCREYMDENVIICRAGGSMESDPGGGMVQKKDQLMKEAQVQSILNDIAHHNPHIVICGNRNASAPCKMPHQYCVLGWYKPLLVWSEKTAGKKGQVWSTIKYRLERLNRDEQPWHAPQDQLSAENIAKAGPLLRKHCPRCKTEYPQIYLQGWMCLNAECCRFWKLGMLDAPYDKEGLDYNPAFIIHRSEQWKNDGDEREPEPSDVRPPVPDVGKLIGDNLAYVNTRGICCPSCGRCNSRRLFRGWVCENASCGYEFFPKQDPVVPVMLHRPWDSAPTLVRNRHEPGVHVQVEHKFGYKISTYTFKQVNGEGIKGCFIHAAASKQLIQESLGADEMFASIQTEDMGLERRTFASKKMSGGKPTAASLEDDTAIEAEQTKEAVEREDSEMRKAKHGFEDGDLMTAFSMNYGMPYKFVANGASQSFDKGPWPVRECRRRLNWAQDKFLNDKSGYMDFNEELIFAYLEGQKIEYHDDGEEGLGPRIATMSFGGRAKMHMRMKAKHYVGCSKTGIFTEDKPVPGSMMYEERLQAWNQLQQDDASNYTKRRKELPKELGIFEKRNKKADDLVTVTLSHGDIIVMDGYDIQKYLEHKVVPEGHLRFALTCRTVLPEHLKVEERPAYAVEVDEEKYEGPVHLRRVEQSG